MTVMILERVPSGLRGELTRWMLEPRAGVFVGTVSALVRDKLWEKVCQGKRTGGAILIQSSDNEQGFTLSIDGDTSRAIFDFEGLFLVRA
jgi:CRISPR-associated protein Cas2